jgi:hypothetical protein
LDQQQMIASSPSSYKAKYGINCISHSLFTDATDSESKSADESGPTDESLTKSQFLRFLRATLFPSVLTLSKRYTVATVMERVNSTTTFVVGNLTQLFDLVPEDDKQPRISFAHLLQFHKAFPHILAFLTVAERIEAQMAVHVAVVTSAAAAAGTKQPPAKKNVNSKPPPITMTRRAGSFQPLSPLHESPEESEYDSTHHAAESDDADVDDSEPEDGAEERDSSDSPLFSFANSSKLSNAQSTSQQSEVSRQDEVLSTPANSRAVSVLPTGSESPTE